jgi:ubiquinone biosynthesis protein
VVEADLRLDATGLDRTLLAQRAVLKMILEDGFFHADPHPGNVFYLPGNRLAFIDFGMVGRLSDTRRDPLLSLMLGLVQREPEAVVEVLLAWTQDSPASSTPDPDPEALQQDVTAILRGHQLALPADLARLDLGPARGAPAHRPAARDHPPG